MEEEQLTFVEQILRLIEQIIRPDWPGLIALLPLLLIALIAVFLIFNAWQWRRAGTRIRSRVPRPLAAGAPPPGVHLPGPSRWPFVLPIGGALILLALVLPPRDDAGQLTAPVNVPLFVLGLIVTGVAIGGWLLDAMREWRAAAHTGEGAGHTAEAVAGTLVTGPQPAALVSGHRPAALIAEQTAVERREPPAEPPPGVHMPGPSPWPFFAPLGITLIFFGLILNGTLVIGGLILAIIAAVGWFRDAGREYRSTEEVGHAVPHTRDPREAWPAWLVPVFLIVAGISVLIALAPLGLQWLGGLVPAEPGETARPVPEAPEITARNAQSFETSTLVVPCCRPFELTFNNEQAGVPHDVDITEGPEREVTFHDGEIITGPDTITYQVEALEEGDYYFLCTVHPNMNGTVEARPEE